MRDLPPIPDNAGPALTSLMGFLRQDPDNLNLLSDCAEAALNDGANDLTGALLERFQKLSPFTPKEAHLSGLLAIKEKRFDDAAQTYEFLADSLEQPFPAIQYNLAWSLSHLKKYEDALKALDRETIEELPQAAELDIQLHHQLAKFTEAEQRAMDYMELHPDHEGLMAAISVLAMDLEKEDLALACARKAGSHPDALTTIGSLELAEQNFDAARDHFEQSMTINATKPRTWLGLGLIDLSTGDYSRATERLDKGAELFGKHLGSWLAAGWAYLVQNDYATARKRFEHALALDDTFAEIHGSLAVLDLIDGDQDEAEQKIKTARRLHKDCFSAALAQVMMLESQGDANKAQRIYETAINRPLDDQGRTIMDALVRVGL